MAVTTNLYSLSTNQAANGPDGNTDYPSSLDDQQRYLGAFLATLRDSGHQYPGVVSGSNTITGTLTPAPTAYITGGPYRFFVATTNTGAVTLNLSSLGAKNVLMRGAALVGGELLAGTIAEVVYDGTSFHLVSVNAPTPGVLSGMALSNNATDIVNDIDVTAGQCADSTGSVLMRGAAMTKRLDAAWAAGTGNGGRLSAAAIANVTYHFFAIRKDSDGSIDYGFDVSPTAPTMPTGYTYFRRIGSVIRASAALLLFVQTGDDFVLTTRVPNTNAAAATTGARTLVAVTVPTGVKMKARLRVTVSNAAGANLLVTSPDETDQGAGNDNSTFPINAGTTVGGQIEVLTDTSAQIGYRSNSANSLTTISTYGWADTRGRT
jgi:hypothetical protein